MKVVIIGAVAAGTSAATEIRRNNKKKQKFLYTKKINLFPMQVVECLII